MLSVRLSGGTGYVGAKVARKALVGKSHLQRSLFKLLKSLQEHDAAREKEACFSLARKSYECRI